MLTAATRVYHCAIELLYVWSSRCEGAKVRRRCELLYFRFDCVTKFSIYYMSFIIYVINCYCVVKLMTEYLSNFICYYLKSDLKIYLAYSNEDHYESLTRAPRHSVAPEKVHEVAAEHAYAKIVATTAAEAEDTKEWREVPLREEFFVYLMTEFPLESFSMLSHD